VRALTGPWVYPIVLAILSAAVATAEAIAPARPTQRQWRRHLGSDVAHLVFNGHFLGVLVYALATRWILPPLDGALARHGLIDALYHNVAAGWPLWLQTVVAFVAIDFAQWLIHNLLHRVPWLWELHKTHHTVADGEMDWIVSFRFHWLEVVVYRIGLYVPLAFFGFAPAALLVHAIVGTLIGHLNHSNLDLGRGAWRYLINSPRMHIWHHDAAATGRTTVNFGIIFSAWDWLFGTAKMPDQPPARLGFSDDTSMPRDFLGQEAWPLGRLVGGHAWAASALGAILLGGAWLLGHHGSAPVRTPMLGESAAQSQPADDRHTYAATPEDASLALARFGDDARAAGFAHPDELVSVRELAAALSSPRLRLIDVRANQGFDGGHIPSAQRMGRADYSTEAPIAGLSRSAGELQAALQRRGVARDSLVVLYGDGGPEPYRLFWTLRTVGGYAARVLDGGLDAWKRDGRGVAAGPPLAVAVGDVTLTATNAPALLWRELPPVAHSAGTILLDARSEREFNGAVKHPDAARAGSIPGAHNLEWLALLRGAGDSRLKSPADLRVALTGAGVDGTAPVVTYCQTGTRSSLAWFAMRQVGMRDEQVVNYNGSWSEYSRLSQP
jgi:3-mercaptopyruvate sulfurtransferase SseA/sterol desaturase/sphingolipid hydroxylase (fatty acid hydroxylase superfamily)